MTPITACGLRVGNDEAVQKTCDSTVHMTLSWHVYSGGRGSGREVTAEQEVHYRACLLKVAIHVIISIWPNPEIANIEDSQVTMLAQKVKAPARSLPRGLKDIFVITTMTWNRNTFISWIIFHSSCSFRQIEAGRRKSATTLYPCLLLLHPTNPPR